MAGAAHNSTTVHRSWRQLEAVDNDRSVRCSTDIGDWFSSAREWQAALTIQLITWRAFKRRGKLQPHMAINFKRRVVTMQALLAICLACSGKLGAAGRKETATKRARDRVTAKAGADKQAVQFGIATGLEGSGIITLADGLEDVDVTFRKAKRVRWGCSRTSTASRSGTGESKHVRRGAETNGRPQTRDGRVGQQRVGRLQL